MHFRCIRPMFLATICYLVCIYSLHTYVKLARTAAQTLQSVKTLRSYSQTTYNASQCFCSQLFTVALFLGFFCRFLENFLNRAGKKSENQRKTTEKTKLLENHGLRLDFCVQKGL
jgi:hypothetical protein